MVRQISKPTQRDGQRHFECLSLQTGKAKKMSNAAHTQRPSVAYAPIRSQVCSSNGQIASPPAGESQGKPTNAAYRYSRKYQTMPREKARRHGERSFRVQAKRENSPLWLVITKAIKSAQAKASGKGKLPTL